MLKIFLILFAMLSMSCQKAIFIDPFSNPLIHFEKADSLLSGHHPSDDNFASHQTVMLQDSKDNSFCSGVIISPVLILTAAHCISGDENTLNVFFGKSAKEITASRKVSKIIVHEEYQDEATKDRNDLALIKLIDPVPENYSSAKFIEDTSILKKETQVLIAGYGSTGSGKFEPTLNILNKKIFNPNYSNTEILFDQRNGSGICGGDSGGPAFVKHKGKWYLWGISSAILTRKDLAECEYKGIITKIYRHSDWLNRALEEIN